MARRLPLSRATRAFVVLALAGSAFGCADGDSDYERFGGLLTNYFHSDPGVQLSVPASIPYATMGVNIGSSSQAVFVLATTQTGGDQMWLAGKQAALVTRDGRIVRTSGLDQNLLGRRVLSEGGERGNLYFYDLSGPKTYNLLVRCSAQDAGVEQISILGAQLNTHHVVEHCEADSVSWAFDNEYWQDPATGFVWRSVQYVHPQQPAIRMDVFRPPSSS